MKIFPDGSAMSVKVREMFIAFRNYNYRLWFAGQLVSLVGTWMQTTAQGYLVYELTHDPAYLGYVAFAGGVAAWLFTLYGGLITDRVPKRILLMITQSVMMVLALVLAALVFTKAIQPWMIIVLAFLLGAANAFDAPARLAFVVEIVSREDISNAIALNASMFNMAIVIGPAVSGLTYDAVGPGWCFLINGLTFVAVIISLFFMRISAAPPRQRQAGSLSEIKEGFNFVISRKEVIVILVNLALVGMFGIGLVSLLPAWVNIVLNGGVRDNGYLLSMRGVGSLIAALLMAYLSAKRVKGRLWSLGSLVLPLAMLVFVFLTDLSYAMAVMVFVGFGYMMVTNSSNALMQDLTPDDLRGRVMGIYTLVFFGLSPVGSLLMGLVASWTNEQLAVGASAVILLGLTLWIRMKVPTMRVLK